MFMTLKYGREDSDDIQYLASANRPDRLANANLSKSACTACRRKKLGCSREKTGCRRCHSRGVECEYEATKTQNKKDEPHNSDSQAPEEPSDHPLDSIFDTNMLSPLNREEASGTMSALRTHRDPHPHDPKGRPDPSARSAAPKQQPGRLGSAHRKALSAVNASAGSDMQMRDGPGMAIDQDSATSSNVATDRGDHYPPTLDEDFSALLDSSLHADGGVIGSGPLSAPELEFSEHLYGNCTNPSYFDSSMDLESNSTMYIPENLSNYSALLDPSPGMSTSSKDSMEKIEADDCECTGSALRVLETAATPLKRTAWSTSEQKLGFLKTNISQCYALAQCTGCSQDSSLTMLVLIICEKLTAIFEEIAQWWSRSRETNRHASQRESSVGVKSSHSRDTPRPEAIQRRHSEQQPPRMSLGSYQIDTLEERYTIFATLVCLQLQRLDSFVAGLKGSSVSYKWTSHSAVAKGLAQRIVRLQAILQS